MILDVSVDEQTYIEDCEVCCRPIQIGYTAEDFELQDFWAESIEQ